MNEWAVFGVIITLVTFIIAVSKPLISLTKAITELTVAVGHLQDRSNKQEEKASVSHKRLWDYNSKQDGEIEANRNKIAEHDIEIKHLKKGAKL